MSSGIIAGNIYGIGIAQVTIDPASVAANTTAEQTFTVPGLKTGCAVFVNKPTATAGLGIVNARISAANTLAVTFVNATAAPIDAASETWTIVAICPDSTQSAIVT